MQAHWRESSCRARSLSKHMYNCCKRPKQKSKKVQRGLSDRKRPAQNKKQVTMRARCLASRLSACVLGQCPCAGGRALPLALRSVTSSTQLVQLYRPTVQLHRREPTHPPKWTLKLLQNCLRSCTTSWTAGR